VRVADDCGDTGQRGNFFGRTLCITSGDDDFGQRILPLHPPDGSAGVLIRGTRDRTSIQYDQVGAVRWSAGEAAGFELALEGGAVGLRGAAAEVFDVEGGHGIMLAQRGNQRLIRARICQAEPRCLPPAGNSIVGSGPDPALTWWINEYRRFATLA